MKRKNAMILIISCIILVIIGLGISIIYSDYIYNPAEGLISISVAGQNWEPDPDWEPGMEVSRNPNSSQEILSFMQEIDAWANAHKATIIHKNAFSAGSGYCDYSGWLFPLLTDLSKEHETEKNKGVYITESNLFKEAYVKDGILMPDSIGLAVSGTYCDEDMPATLANVDFLYPLNMSTIADGVYLTDAQEVDSLVRLFEENGYQIIYLNKSLSMFELAQRMLTDGFVTRAAVCAMVGLLFCFIYNILLLYRENLRSLQIRHIFGLSKKRMLFNSVGIALLIAVIAIGLFSVILFNGLSYTSMYDLKRLFFYVAIGITALSIGTSLVCAISINSAVTKVR